MTHLTPLGAAALRGHASTAELLARRDGSRRDGADRALAGLFRAGTAHSGCLRLSHLAAKCSRGAAFDRLAALFRPGDQNAKDDAFLGPLHWACSGRRGVHNIRKLVGMKAWVDDADAEGSTPLYYLACLDADDRASVDRGFAALFGAGAAVDHVNRRGLSPLGHAAAELRPHLMALLLGAGADPDGRVGGVDALPDAHDGPDQRPASALLRAHERLSRDGLDEQRSAAAARGIELLLAHGSRVDRKRLFKHMLRCNLTLAPLLLRLWADMAAPLALREVEQLFRGFGAAPCTQWRVNASLGFMLDHCVPASGAVLDAWGLVPGLLATRAVCAPGLMRLAGPGFDADGRDGRGRTSLMQVLANEAYEHDACALVVDELLRRGANTRARAAGGQTCLHGLVLGAPGSDAAAYARSFGRTLTALARRGLDVDAADPAGNGGGVLHYLARLDESDALAGCARALLVHGADADRTDDEGRTALGVYLERHRGRTRCGARLRGWCKCIRRCRGWAVEHV